VSAQRDTWSEEWRRVCEARHYLREGYTTAEMVCGLRKRIAEKRGAAAAEEVIEEMRRQWRTRAEWMSPEP